MARLVRCILFLMMIVDPQANAGVHPDCLGEVLNYIHHNGARGKDKEVLTRLAYYNDNIFKSFKSVPEAEWQNVIDQTIRDYAGYDGRFNGEAFQSWLKENPGVHAGDTKLGDYLSERVDTFSKTNPVQKIDHITGDVATQLEKIGKKCGQDVACNQRNIAQFFNSKLDNFCLRKQPKLIQDMTLSLAISNVSYMKFAHDHPDQPFPYDLMINGLFWTPISQELNCRATLGGAEKLGHRVDFDQPITRKEAWRRAGKSYATYMKTSPLYSGSYIVLNLGRQLITGKKEIKEEDLTWDNIYDAAFAVPRSVLLLDPANRMFAPRFQRNLAYKEKNYLQDHAAMAAIPKWFLKNNVYSKVAIGIPQSALKIESTTLSTGVFRAWQSFSDEKFNTHYKQPFEIPSPTPTPQKTR